MNLTANLRPELPDDLSTQVNRRAAASGKRARTESWRSPRSKPSGRVHRAPWLKRLARMRAARNKPRWSIVSLALPVVGIVVLLGTILIYRDFFGVPFAYYALMFACGCGDLCGIISLVRRERSMGLTLTAMFFNTLLGVLCAQGYYGWSHHAW